MIPPRFRHSLTSRRRHSKRAAGAKKPTSLALSCIDQWFFGGVKSDGSRLALGAAGKPLEAILAPARVAETAPLFASLQRRLTLAALLDQLEATAANILLRSVGQQAFCDLRSANPASGFLTIKGTFRFRYKSARISRQRGIVTRPPRASSARRADRRLRHCLDRPIFQFHPTQKPQRPEVDAQGLFSRFLSSTVRSR